MMFIGPMTNWISALYFVMQHNLFSYNRGRV